MRECIASRNGISLRSLYRYEAAFKKEGFSGLKPAERPKQHSAKLPDNFKEILEQAVQLKREVPTRSVNQIIYILELEGWAPVDVYKRQPQNYWSNTSGNAIVRRLIDKADSVTKNEVESLIAGDEVIKEIHQELTYSELDQSIENLWSVLFTTGYLTQRGRVDGRKYRDVYKRQRVFGLNDLTRAQATDDTKAASMETAKLKGFL